MLKAGKILMLVENLSVPADRRVWAEATSLRDHGFQVSIICPKGVTEHRESYTCLENIHVYRYKLSANGQKHTAYITEYCIAMLMTFWLSFKVLFRHGFDVIHAANPPDTFFMLGLFYKLLGKKFIFDQHDLAPEMFRAKFKKRTQIFYKSLLFLEKRAYRTANLVIVTNRSFQRVAIERGGCCADKIFVVRNGPDLKRIKLAISEPEPAGKHHHLLAYVGVMGIQDGVQYTLYALHELVHKRGRKDVSLVLIGDGDQINTLLGLCQELQLNEYVNFTGWVTNSDVMQYLAAMDVGLSPDPQNGLNEHCTMIKTMEYMAMGKPLVAFDLAETRFSAQNAALYATPNSVEDFADKIEILLDDEELRLRMGDLGRKRIEDALGWDHSEKMLLQAYKTLFPH